MLSLVELRKWPSRIRRSFLRLSLFEQYVVLSTSALAISFVTIGIYISDRVIDEVLQSVAGPQALYVSSFVEPSIQQLATNDVLDSNSAATLDHLRVKLANTEHLLSIKIWNLDSVLVHGVDKSLIGKRFPAAEIDSALSGKIVARRTTLSDDDDNFERSIGIPMYELFAPLYENRTGKLIAVGEFYQDASELVKRTDKAISIAWTFLAVIGVALWLFLLFVVRVGSNTIDKQKQLLRDRLRTQIHLRSQNETLARQVQLAMLEVERIDDQVEQEVALHLHDGAAQLLSLSLLKIDVLANSVSGLAREEMENIWNLVNDALKDVRSIARDLFLPQTEGANIVDSVLAVVESYSRQTGKSVETRLANHEGPIDSQIIRCAARVVREALSNSFKHAAGEGQFVELSFDAQYLTLLIGDLGPGMASERKDRLGIKGMKARVEALSGKLSISKALSGGTIVSALIPLQPIPGAVE